MAKRGPGIRAAAEIKDWAILLYLVADHDGDDLDDSLIEELKTIIAAAKSILPSAHVAYQVDLKDTDGVFRHRIDGTERAADKPPLPKVKEETFAASPNNLREFFKWSKEECPARHHAVFFWGHSAGPAGLFPMFIAANPDFGPALRLDALAVAAAGPPSVFDHAGPALRALFADRLEQEIMLDRVDPADPLRLFSLKNEIKSAFGTVDLVAFKDCWMSTLETAAEMAGATKYMVASQSIVPVVGWPYAKMFNTISEASATDLRDAVAKVVSHLGTHYGDPEHRRLTKRKAPPDEVPFTGLELEGVSAVTGPLKVFVKAWTDMTDNLRDRARRAMQHASAGDEASLLDATSLSGAVSAFADLRDSSNELKRVLNDPNGLIVRHRTQEANSGFTGVSLFYDSNDGRSILRTLMDLRLREYAKLALNRQTGWKAIAFDDLDN